MNFYIDSEQGRIGPYWWINSDTNAFHLILRSSDGAAASGRFVRWGSAGYGNEPHIVLSPVNEE